MRLEKNGKGRWDYTFDKTYYFSIEETGSDRAPVLFYTISETEVEVGPIKLV